MEFVNYNDTVEGGKCAVYARALDWKGLREDPITGDSMTVYELSRNCSVEVTDPLVLKEEEKKMREENGVHTDLGDKIKGEAITLFVDTLRKIKFEVVEGMTATHGGNVCSTNSRTVGIIKYPFPNLIKLLNKKP